MSKFNFVQRALETVGLSERVPADPILTKCQENLDRFDNLIDTFKKNAKAYSESVIAMSTANGTFAADINKFFRKAPAPQQQPSNVLTNSYEKSEETIRALFRDRFGWDVLRELDNWHDACRILKDRIKTTSTLRAEAYHLGSKLESQRGKGKMTSSEDEHLYEAQTKTVTEQRDKIEADVNEMIESRYARMNVIVARYLEIQANFAAELSKATASFSAIAASFAKPGSTPTAANAQTKVSVTPTARVVAESKTDVPTSPVASTTPTPVAATPVSPSPAPVPEPVPEPVASRPPKQEDSSISGLSAFLSSMPGEPSPAASSKESSPTAPTPASKGVFDIFGTASTPSPASASATSGVSSVSGGGSAAGMDIFGLVNNSANKPASPLPSPASSTSSKPVTTSSSSNDLSALFGNDSKATTPSQAAKPSSDLDGFLFGGGPRAGAQPPKPANSTTAASAGISSIDALLASGKSSSGGASSSSSYSSSSRYADIDDVDDDMTSRPAPKPTAAKFDPLDVNSMLAAAKSPKTPVPAPAAKPAAVAQPEPEQFANAEEEKEAIMQMKARLQGKVNQWKTGPGGETKSLYQLLGSLQSVLWAGAPPLNFNLSDLLDHAGIRKAYRKAVLVIHPDRVTTGTVEMKATADLVFDVLSESMKSLESS